MKQFFNPHKKTNSKCNIILLSAMLAALSFNAYAQLLSAREIYQIAKRGDVDYLQNLGRHIDVTDSDGVSAICLAVANRDRATYDALVAAGADTDRNCAGTPNTIHEDSFHWTVPTLVAAGVLIGGIIAIGSSNHTPSGADAVVFGQRGKNVANPEKNTIKLETDKVAYGLWAQGDNATAVNSGTIDISYGTGKSSSSSSKESTGKLPAAVGIFGEAGSTLTNEENAKINISDAKLAIGIYAENGKEGAPSKILNLGSIEITNSDHAYGIWAAGEYVEVVNLGTITIDEVTYDIENPDECYGSDCKKANHAVVLNGGSLTNDGVINVDKLDISASGGMFAASAGAVFNVKNAISGDLAMSSDIVKNGFDTTYTVDGMINAGDTSGLNLVSQSALFDATLENNTDAVLTMKAFGDVVENRELADYLQANYAEGNNESLFAALKSATSAAQLNGNLNDLFGKEMLSHMAFEDLTMMREINFDMNNRLFEQKGTFAFGENISPAGYDDKIGSVGRYSLNGFNNGKMSFGVGVSVSDVRTDNSHSGNRRFDRNFMLSAPFGYKTHGFELITAPKLGYAAGTYDRTGLNNMSYEGKVQKRMFGLMNEARYPLKFGGLKIVPTAEFNLVGYNISGRENEQEFNLKIKSQNHYSVETGFGLMAQKEFRPFKNHKLSLNGGVSVYHEFADPYALNVAMNGMSGTYQLRDDKRGDNRAVVRFGFGYKLKDYLDFSANLLTDISREYRTDAGLDLKYSF
ncbi:MAG: autotransporter outer membrane beta-barrel domain-containing protein [Alphaproteobacteria bacterium]|nr:autotransporter outer membrane beta-barrel domain-containing protein [Alphaproteobacteria bacterium]